MKPYRGLELAGGFCPAGAGRILEENPGGQDMLVGRGSLIVRGDLTRPLVYLLNRERAAPLG